MVRIRPAHVRIARWLLALALLPAGLVLPAGEAGAVPSGQGQPGVTMAVRAGFGDSGHYLINEWFPVRVSLANPAGAPSLRVRVEADSYDTNSSSSLGTYAREVDLPSQSRKEVMLYAYTNGFAGQVSVRLVQGDTVVKSERASISGLERSDVILGVVSSDASLLNVMRGEKVGHTASPFVPTGYGAPSPPGQSGVRVTVAHIAPEDLPDLSPALNSLGALVMEDVDTGALSGEQVAAVRAWVARGGTLVLASRPGGAPVTSAFADLLPVTENGTGPLPGLDGLADFVMLPITPTSTVLATSAALRTEPEIGARLLAAQDGKPLVASREVGEGRVVYMAVSPAMPPLKTWDGTVPLFKRLLAEYRSGVVFGTVGVGAGYYPGYRYGMYYGGPVSVFDYQGNIFDLPGLDLPSPIVIALFLLVYIIILGPVNFAILRRRRKPELAWLTTPVLVVIFSAGAYVLGFQAKGGDIVTVRADLAQAAPGVDDVQAMQLYGLFSPLRDTYRINLAANSVVAPMEQYDYGSAPENPTTVIGGSTTTVDNVRVPTGSLKGFVGVSSVKAQSPLETDLWVENNSIAGTVRNRSSGGLQNVALLRGSSVQHIGYLAPGETARVNLAVSTSRFNVSSPASVLPPPPGATAQNPGYYGSQTSNEQREYNRRIYLLNLGLAPLLESEPPSDMDVIALAWGAELPMDVAVEGHTTRSHDMSLWTNRAKVRHAGSSPRLSTGSVPYWAYVPSHDPAWVSAESLRTASVTLAPYVDFNYALPMGTQPQSLTLRYRVSVSWGQGTAVVARAFNVRTGEWDDLFEVTSPGGSVSSQDVAIENPADYVGPGGDFTLRLAAQNGDASISGFYFELGMNQ